MVAILNMGYHSDYGQNEKQSKLISKCCMAEVKISSGTEDFVGEKDRGQTNYYVCLRCGRACEVIGKEVKIMKNYKRNNKEEKLNLPIMPYGNWYGEEELKQVIEDIKKTAYTDGWNDAVKKFNEKIEKYLKGGK